MLSGIKQLSKDTFHFEEDMKIAENRLSLVQYVPHVDGSCLNFGTKQQFWSTIPKETSQINLS